MTFGIEAESDAFARIAETLGIPAQHLSDDAHTAHLSGALECLRLWQEIKTEDGMRRALAALEDIVADGCAATRVI